MRKLFVIMPFGSKDVNTQIGSENFDFDLVYNELIVPAGLAASYKVLRIDQVTTPGRISDQYLRELFTADSVVADITLPNANVFYELGIRQTMGTGPTILIARTGTQLPFDLHDQRVLFYDLTLERNRKLAQANLIEALGRVIEEPGANPIFHFLSSIGVTTSPSKDKASFEQDLRGRIERARNTSQLIGVWMWAQNFDPLPALTLVSLANRLADAGEWSMAATVVEKAIEGRPLDFELHRQHGWYLRNLDTSRYGEAELAFKKALELNPFDPETLGMLAGLFKRLERFSEAADLYERGAAISPANLYMRVNRAAMELLAAPDAPSVAIALYRELLNDLIKVPIGKKDEWTDLVAGESEFVIGDLSAAKRHFEVAARNAKTLNILLSPADQIELFGKAGFRKAEAAELGSWMRALHERLSQPLISSVAEHGAAVKSSADLPIIIHLSDVHFGTRPGSDGKPVKMHRFYDGDYSETLATHLIKEFTSSRRHFILDGRPVYLIVSGDLTYTATPDEFNEAKQFLQDLCDSLRIPKDRVALCPGNHDVNWALSKIDKAHRFDNYLSFLLRFYGEELFRELYPRVQWDFKVDTARPAPTDILSARIFKDDSLLILSLNSCVYETEEHHYGFVSGRQLRISDSLLERIADEHDLIKICVVHHHLHPFPEPITLNSSGDHWHDQSTIRDSALLEKYLEKNAFDMVLHGHKHKPQLRETVVRDPGFTDGMRPLIVFGAGSCGVDSKELEHSVPNHYEVIELLNVPRLSGANFVRAEWREISLAPGAEWTTPRTWVLRG